MARAEDLFTAEASLRAAAVDFASWDKATNRAQGIDRARMHLRACAILYARLAEDLDAAEAERWKSIEEKGR